MEYGGSDHGIRRSARAVDVAVDTIDLVVRCDHPDANRRSNGQKRRGFSVADPVRLIKYCAVWQHDLLDPEMLTDTLEPALTFVDALLVSPRRPRCSLRS
eukprot:COSAG01_NODE_7080_length_3362_cov_2.022372_4_plen_100_part_00